MIKKNKRKVMLIRVSEEDHKKLKVLGGKNFSKWALSRLLQADEVPVDGSLGRFPLTTQELASEAIGKTVLEERPVFDMDKARKAFEMTIPEAMTYVAEEGLAQAFKEAEAKVIKEFNEEPVKKGPIPLDTFVKSGVIRVEPSVTVDLGAVVITEEQVKAISVKPETQPCAMCGLQAKPYARATGKLSWLCDSHKP